MKIKLPGFFRSGQTGFTLIEVIVSLALSSLIGLGAAMTIAQVCTQTSRNSDITTASRHAMNAVHFVGRDIQMAQTISGTAGFPATSNLELSWTWWDNKTYSVNYSVTNGVLTRVYSDGITQTQTVVAEYISPDLTSTNCTSDNGTLVFTVTTMVGEGVNAISITRSREIAARPHL